MLTAEGCTTCKNRFFVADAHTAQHRRDCVECRATGVCAVTHFYASCPTCGDIGACKSKHHRQCPHCHAFGCNSECHCLSARYFPGITADGHRVYATERHHDPHPWRTREMQAQKAREWLQQAWAKAAAADPKIVCKCCPYLGCKHIWLPPCGHFTSPVPVWRSAYGEGVARRLVTAATTRLPLAVGFEWPSTLFLTEAPFDPCNPGQWSYAYCAGRCEYCNDSWCVKEERCRQCRHECSRCWREACQACAARKFRMCCGKEHCRTCACVKCGHAVESTARVLRVGSRGPDRAPRS